MKKTLFVLLATTFSFFAANAQQHLTLKAGGGLALFPGYSLSNTYPGMAIDFGVGYKHQISERMVLEGDVLMADRNYSVELFGIDVDPADGNNDLLEVGGTYVQVPLTIHYNMPFKKKELVPYHMGQPKTKFFVEGGPYFAYALSIDAYMDPNTVALWSSVEEDPLTEEDLVPRSIDVGVTGGLGLNFGFSESLHRMTVGARMNYGLMNIYKDSRLGQATNMSVIGYVSWDIALSKKQYYHYRW